MFEDVERKDIIDFIEATTPIIITDEELKNHVWEIVKTEDKIMAFKVDKDIRDNYHEYTSFYLEINYDDSAKVVFEGTTEFDVSDLWKEFRSKLTTGL